MQKQGDVSQPFPTRIKPKHQEPPQPGAVLVAPAPCTWPRWEVPANCAC